MNAMNGMNAINAMNTSLAVTSGTSVFFCREPIKQLQSFLDRLLICSWKPSWGICTDRRQESYRFPVVLKYRSSLTSGIIFIPFLVARLTTTEAFFLRRVVDTLHYTNVMLLRLIWFYFCNHATQSHGAFLRPVGWIARHDLLSCHVINSCKCIFHHFSPILCWNYCKRLPPWRGIAIIDYHKKYLSLLCYTVLHPDCWWLRPSLQWAASRVSSQSGTLSIDKYQSCTSDWLPNCAILFYVYPHLSTII
jgi:hypothetical protein